MGGGYVKETDSFSQEVRLIDYIQQNYDKEISLKRMAADLGYNYTYLSDIFNKVFGCGFSKYVNRIRVEDAAEMLRISDYSVAQISAYCGFNNIRSLNLQFRSVYGKTPTAYRKEMQAKTQGKRVKTQSK